LESLRTHPPAGGFSRECEIDIELAGYTIPANTMVKRERERETNKKQTNTTNKI